MNAARNIVHSISLATSVALILLSCQTKETAKVTVANDHYTVEARSVSGPASAPYSVSISYTRTGSAVGKGDILIREVGLHRRASLELSDKNILLVQMYDGGSGVYYLANLDSNPGEFEWWLNSSIEIDSNIWRADYEDHEVSVDRLADSPAVCRILYRTSLGRLELFVLGAKSVAESGYEPRLLMVDIEWLNGDKTDELAIRFPERGITSIEVDVGSAGERNSE